MTNSEIEPEPESEIQSGINGLIHDKSFLRVPLATIINSPVEAIINSSVQNILDVNQLFNEFFLTQSKRNLTTLTFQFNNIIYRFPLLKFFEWPLLTIQSLKVHMSLNVHVGNLDNVHNSHAISSYEASINSENPNIPLLSARPNKSHLFVNTHESSNGDSGIPLKIEANFSNRSNENIGVEKLQELIGDLVTREDLSQESENEPESN